MPNELLIQLVGPYADNVSAQDVLNDLNAKTHEERYPGMRTYRTLTLSHGPTFVATILGKLKAGGATNPLLDATYFAMCGEGIDFSLDVTQGLLEQLRGVLFTDEETVTLKEIGVKHFSTLEVNNLSNITVEDVQAAIDAKISRRDNLAWFVNIYNTVLPQIQDGTITRQQIKDLINV